MSPCGGRGRRVPTTLFHAAGVISPEGRLRGDSIPGAYSVPASDIASREGAEGFVVASMLEGEPRTCTGESPWPWRSFRQAARIS